jgi:tetratricopeptide (TPR) repeat protein
MESNMSEQDHILSLVREADLYQNQGLLSESKGKYAQALALIESHTRLADRENLVEAVRKKIRKVDETIAEAKATPKVPDLSPQLRNLIKKSFSFSRTREVASMEGALALAKFGQYEEAIQEFQSLLKQGSLPIVTARHILRCYFSLSLPYAAIAQFRDWASSHKLSKEDLRYIRDFLEEALKEAGFKGHLPSLLGEEPIKSDKSTNNDTLDISAIRIQFTEGPFKGEALETDVISQFGSLVSVLIPARREDLVGAFRIGKRLERIQCYSSITFFMAQGIVSRKSTVERGPRQGDHIVDITIEGE